MCECFEYADGWMMLCPPCADWHRQTLARIIQENAEREEE